ncbi:Oidioi.mRNA.OKI2018_I69.PAR.g10324.t1.cds [Oikopleura dioica]|uniref:Oidioi.mRNA.OKI2018_I69.PAR.g10324.t1.cds n=1 Tax=Oikopleura dioica TaxID=34765 RepID=A0ABN7RTM5_OIKDI|nr:Oidioi.mRNA.OKI2018_I69.PAR.g10324.t1.cds [Oikopleura dioica]
MKLFVLSLAALASAQRPKRNKNKNNNYPKTTTPAYETTTYYATTEAQEGAYNDNGQFGTGGAYGDPHFMVAAPKTEPICFDYNPPADSEMTLIMDPESNLFISARVDSRRQGKTRFMTRLTIMSPLGATMSIDENGVHVEGLPGWAEALKEPTESGIIEYGDIKYTEQWSEDGARDKITLEINNGPHFLIKEKAFRETISFGIQSSQGLSEKTRGVLGQFVHNNAYTIKQHSETEATVNIDGFEVSAKWEEFHRNSECWTIEEDQLLDFFSQF